MTATLAKIWINEFEGRKELRTDFTNDRHHAVLIEAPHGAEQIANALSTLAYLIATDATLVPNA